MAIVADRSSAVPRRASASADAATRSRARTSTALDRWALRRIQAFVSSARLRFALWDGFTLEPRGGGAVGTLRFNRRSALAGPVLDPETYLGDAYMAGALDIDGDLVAVLEQVYRTFGRPRRTWAHPYRPHDSRAARASVHHHYDLGNDFYRLWLDREMVYTCAYFPTPFTGLDEAQRAKMDLVCRKLWLRPGERVVEAGCGWGALALFMARHYGVRVRAFNISTEQIAFARDRARAEGLDGQVEFVEDDYRNISGRYDAFVSIGMLEHVGRDQYDAFGAVIDRVLGAAGRGMLHFIGRDQPAPLNAWIRKRIFPGAYAPTLAEASSLVLAAHGLSVFDVENLRRHYAKTLQCWRERFEDSAARVDAMFDDSFVRAWRLYLAGSQAAFTTGWMQLFQVVFTRSGSSATPWTRATF